MWKMLERLYCSKPPAFLVGGDSQVRACVYIMFAHIVLPKN